MLPDVTRKKFDITRKILNNIIKHFKLKRFTTKIENCHKFGFFNVPDWVRKQPVLEPWHKQRCSVGGRWFADIGRFLLPSPADVYQRLPSFLPFSDPPEQSWVFRKTFLLILPLPARRLSIIPQYTRSRTKNIFFSRLLTATFRLRRQSRVRN